MLHIPDTVFRAYDIRGIVDKDFDTESIVELGKAIGTYFAQNGHKVAVIGHDCRLSSPAFHDAIAAGLASCGIDSISLGMVPTPVLYFGVKHLQKNAGVMITASHNPGEYNGFKIWSGESTIHSTEITKIRDILRSRNFVSGKGIGSSTEILLAYCADITQRIHIKRKLKVVVDGGNGAGGEICASLLEQLGLEVVKLYCEPDGRFPNHHPDPVVESNLADLKAKVLSEQADFGVGLDGDADRIGAMDSNGRLLFGDELLSIFAKEVIARKPKARIIGDVKCSQRLFDAVAEYGGTPEMWITGHSMIKARMAETKAELAGEMSGHMFFVDRWYGFDDAIYSATRLAEILSATEEPLKAMPHWPDAVATPEIHIDCPENKKKEVIKKAQEMLKKEYETSEIDGVRFKVGNGWGLVRASNTQPVLVLRYEAENAQKIAQLREMLEPQLHQWINA